MIAVLRLVSVLIVAAVPAMPPPRSVPAASAHVATEAAAGDAAEQTYGVYAGLLSRYVTPQGVRYAAWRAAPLDVKALSGTVAGLASTDPKPLSAADRLALFINLYNAKILEIVLTESPRRSIKEVTPGVTGFGVFLKPALDLGGERLSLRQLEDLLRREAKDPRVHFAINCASRSCPPIAPEPFRGHRLDEQLDRAARAFLASPGALVVKHGKSLLGSDTTTIEVSKIFDWYEKDFRTAGGPLAFIARFGPASVAGTIGNDPGATRLAYQTYDWSLNAAP